jgi:hypothetical protein
LIFFFDRHLCRCIGRPAVLLTIYLYRCREGGRVEQTSLWKLRILCCRRLIDFAAKNFKLRTTHRRGGVLNHRFIHS